jgi:hypothetical protein
MKIKIIPLTLAAVLSAVLLFGGWTVYRQYSVEEPVSRVAQSVTGVESAHAKLEAGQLVLDLKLSPEANLAEIYREVMQEAGQRFRGKKLELNVESSVSDKLEEAWRYSLFEVAEAMENRRYSDIRKAMDHLQERFPGVTAYTEMDQDNVYIRLVEGEHAKFVVLPRQPVMLEVWQDA